MTIDDEQDGQILAALANLRTYDVSRRRTRRLRRQCHALMQSASGSNTSAALRNSAVLRRIVAPALGASWCLAFLVEIIRRAAAFHP